MKLTRESFYSEGWDADRLSAEVELWDASTAANVAKCPRYGEYSICYALRLKGEAYQLKAGSAVHAALAALYSGLDPDYCLQLLAETWGHDADWRLPPGHKYHHLHLGHLEVVFKNYVDYARKRDTFVPLKVKRADLNLDRVIAGYWDVTDDGFVVLGESKFIMRFDLQLPSGEVVQFDYAGKPDLPIRMGGVVRMMDHKTSNGYLSTHWAEKFKHSLQLRGYCAMLGPLTGLTVGGALVNGIYVGDKASSSESKASKFERYGPFDYSPGNLNEALLSQYYWKQQLFHYADQGFFPQNAGMACQGCDMDRLCTSDPMLRQAVMDTEYVRSDETPMDRFLKL